MKKRAMKKWIPKNTSYCCHSDGKPCKWHRINENKPNQENGYCIFINEGDWEDQNYDTLLWDKCKECGVSEEDSTKYKIYREATNRLFDKIEKGFKEK